MNLLINGGNQIKKSGKLGILLILLITTFTSCLVLNKGNELARAQMGESGYFEGDVPLRGVYLQSINCYPVFGVDKNEDGVMDLGYSYDFDENGVE